MPRRTLDSAAMPKPLGPYAPAVAASGELIFVSGQPGLDIATGEVPPDFAAQARHAFENLAAVLRASGSSMAEVVKVTVYLADASQFDPLNQLYAEYFPTDPPARATPVVQLPRGLLISIEAVAVASA
jgi:2-iminobutanoate/2-iminopropanoate deaminase